MRIPNFFILFLVTFFCVSMSSAASIKIGIFDMQKIIDTSQKGKDAKALLKKFSKDMESELISLKNKVKELEENIKKQALVLSDSKRNEKIRELRILENDFKYFQNKFTSEIKKKEQEISNDITINVIKIVKNIGKKGIYDIILEKREAGIVFFKDSYDITNEIVKQYDTQNSNNR